LRIQRGYFADLSCVETIHDINRVDLRIEIVSSSRRVIETEAHYELAIERRSSGVGKCPLEVPVVRERRGVGRDPPHGGEEKQGRDNKRQAMHWVPLEVGKRLIPGGGLAQAIFADKALAQPAARADLPRPNYYSRTDRCRQGEGIRFAVVREAS
jgi:hypothetical protein